MGYAGLLVVGLMTLLCVGTLPYTLAHVDDGSAGGRSPRRFEARDLDAALLPPFWANHADDERQRVDALTASRGEPPRYWLGTDRLGRSMLIRCLAGGGISLAIGMFAAALAVFIGTAYGTLSATSGGRTDAMLMRIVDVLYGLPYILLVVLLSVAVDGIIERQSLDVGSGWRQVVNVLTLLVAIGGVTWLTVARVVRGQVLSLKKQPFMEACQAIGVPYSRRFVRHLLPNLIGPIIVPTAILSESFLSFLGIGVREPLPSWGNLAAGGLSELNIVRARWWLLAFPCLLIGMTLLALNFAGEGLREVFDPKRRGVTN